MFKRIRKKSERPTRSANLQALPPSERFSLSAELPVGDGAPLWRVDVQVLQEPHADGDKVRVRAHLQTNFASALKPALQHRAPAGESGSRTLAQRAGSLVQRSAQRALEVPLLRALAEPLLQLDFNTWVEIDASTASLDSGSRDLLPQADKLRALGIQPRTGGGDAPVAENWAGQAPGGYAQVSLLQLDKRHLPQRLAALLGERPFQLAAAIVSTVEEK